MSLSGSCWLYGSISHGNFDSLSNAASYPLLRFWSNFQNFKLKLEKIRQEFAICVSKTCAKNHLPGCNLCLPTFQFPWPVDASTDSRGISPCRAKVPSSRSGMRSSQLIPGKKPALLSMKYWLFKREPYNGLLQSPHNWVYIIPYPKHPAVLFIAQVCQWALWMVSSSESWNMLK